MRREKLEPYVLTFFHWLALPVFVYWFVTALQRRAWHEFAVFLIANILFGAWGISATFHRLFSHRSYAAPRAWQWCGGILGTLGMQGCSLAWVSVHREHHAQSDTDKDPHSPQFKGPLKVLFLTIFAKPNMRNSVDLLRDPLHVRLFKYYWCIVFIYVAALTILVEPRAILYAWWMPVAKAFYTSNFVNAWNHGWSQKNSPVRNSSLLGLLSMGEGWHANHHDNPASYKCFHGSGIFDVGSWPGFFFTKYKRQ